MRNLLIFFCIVSTSFAITAKEAYIKAKSLEKAGDIQDALLWYKKSAELSLNIKKKEIEKNIKSEVFKRERLAHNNKLIEAYKTNYIMPVTYNTVYHNGRKSVETEFQISIKKKLLSNFLGLNERLYFGYTQRSFWQTTKKSSPFRETNYMPEFFVVFPYVNKITYLNSYKIGLLHQSNGRGGLNSRSWNRLYLQGFFKYKKITIVPRVWYRLPERKKRYPLDANGDDNPDIWNYMGYGDLKIIYPYKKHRFSFIFRDNLRSHNNKGAIKFKWTFPLFKDGIYGYIQLFNGYGESLIDYNKQNSKIGIGFAITR